MPSLILKYTLLGLAVCYRRMSKNKILQELFFTTPHTPQQPPALPQHT